jgi:hypothetical protein
MIQKMVNDMEQIVQKMVKIFQRKDETINDLTVPAFLILKIKF